MRFEEKLNELVGEKNSNNVYLTDAKYSELVSKIKLLKRSMERKQPSDYKLLKKYDLLNVGSVEKLISPMSENTTTVKYFVKLSDIYDILNETHIRVGHGGRNRMRKEVGLKYKNISIECVQIFINLCRHCQEKASKKRDLPVTK